MISQCANLFKSQPFPPHSLRFTDLDYSLQAARKNLILSHHYTHTLSHSFHNVFLAAIAIVVQSFLPNKTTPSDSLLVSQAVNTLTDLGKQMKVRKVQKWLVISTSWCTLKNGTKWDERGLSRIIIQSR